VRCFSPRTDVRRFSLTRPACLAAALLLVLVCASAEALPPRGLGQAEAPYERGVRAMRQGDVDAAVEALARAVELAPDDARALSAYAQALLVSGDAEGSAATLERLREVDPGAPGFDYFVGLASYQLGNWEATRESLQRSLAVRPESAFSHLFLGVAHQELGDLEDARREFDEAERLDPSLKGQIAYRRALLAVTRQRYGDAREYFQVVRERRPESLLGRSAASYLSMLDRRSPRGFEFYATLGGGYDSNVNLSPDDDPALVSNRDDGLAILEVGGSYRYGTGPYDMRVGQSFYTTFYGDEHDFDQEISRSWIWGQAKLPRGFSADLGYTFEYVWVDWDSFRFTHAVEPGLSFELDNVLLRAFYRFEDRNYEQSLPSPNLDRDGHVQRAGADVYAYLPNSFGWGSNWLRIGYRYRVEDADGRDFDASGNEPVITLGLPLPWDLLLIAQGRFEWRNYDHASSLAPAAGRRKDTLARFWTGLSRSFGEHLSVELRYRYTHRDSNVAVFDYDRHEARVLATYQY